MLDVLQAFGLGLIVGAIFGVVKFDPPAPATWAGLAGIVGIVLGWHLIVGALPVIKDWL